MASQTKVDSVGRRSAERRVESSSPSHPSDTSASGTYAAPADAGGASSARVAELDEGEGEAAPDGPSHSEPVVAAASPDDERSGTDSERAAVRVSSIQELGSRAAGGDDDEDVSIDELLISDSTDDDEEDEEEATDIHPGLSESLLAESLRPAGLPRLAHPAIEAEVSLDDPAALDGESNARPVSEVTAASDMAGDEPVQLGDEPLQTDAALLDPDPEAVVVSATAEELEAEDEPRVEGAEVALDAGVEQDAVPESVPPESEAAMEVELAPESEVIPESVPLDGDGLLDTEAEPAVAAELQAVEVEETTAEPPRAAPVPPTERQTVPETFAAKRRDAPLPSFDIPELEAASARRGDAAGAPVAPVALPALSEDDDDAVTHMGLPVVPEVANDYPGVAASGFAVADPQVAALQSLDADIARGDSRRATTRVIPRLDPKSIPQRPRTDAPAGPPLRERLLGVARDAWERVSSLVPSVPADPTWGGEVSPGRRRLSWLAENVLPPLSLVLFGSGLGAGVIMLVDNDEPAQAVQSLQDSSSAARLPQTLADRARAGDGDALYKITNLPQDERTSTLTLALEAGHQAQKEKELREFVKATSGISAPLPASAVARVVEYATSPETMLAAFQEVTQWPGSTGPDLLYAVWEKAAGGSRAASLAQQLLYSADQRAKASPALQVALDLRAATSCDDYLRVLPAVVRDGDQRSSATLRYLGHSDGCGTDGKQDCYPCLREGQLLDNALEAVERR